jgi:TatD DNase family protein
MLVDTHCHLFMEPLCDDVDGVIRRASAAGVERIVVPAFDTDSWDRIAVLCRREELYPALGLHPWMAEEELEVDELHSKLQGTGAVAVGEIGLDFKNVPPSQSMQIRILKAQLDLALSMDLPVILHCRGAFEELLSILSHSRYRRRLKGVIHAFTRSPQIAERFTDIHFHVAFGGAVTRPGARRTRQSATSVPDRWILIETDAPSIGMHDLSPEHVEPCHAARVAESLAELRSTSLQEVCSITSSNAERLFRFDE